MAGSSKPLVCTECGSAECHTACYDEHSGYYGCHDVNCSLHLGDACTYRSRLYPLRMREELELEARRERQRRDRRGAESRKDGHRSSRSQTRHESSRSSSRHRHFRAPSPPAAAPETGSLPRTRYRSPTRDRDYEYADEHHSRSRRSSRSRRPSVYADDPMDDLTDRFSKSRIRPEGSAGHSGGYSGSFGQYPGEYFPSGSSSGASSRHASRRPSAQFPFPPGEYPPPPSPGEQYYSSSRPSSRRPSGQFPFPPGEYRLGSHPSSRRPSATDGFPPGYPPGQFPHDQYPPGYPPTSGQYPYGQYGGQYPGQFPSGQYPGQPGRKTSSEGSGEFHYVYAGTEDPDGELVDEPSPKSGGHR